MHLEKIFYFDNKLCDKSWLERIVYIIIDITSGDVVGVRTHKKGTGELGRALVLVYIYFVETFVGIHPQALTKCLEGFGPNMHHEEFLVVKFIGLDKKYILWPL